MRGLLLCIIFSWMATGCGCTGDGYEGHADTWIDPLSEPQEPETTDMVGVDSPWDLPIESLGEPGWRGSAEPYCRPHQGVLHRPAVWSDGRGVFVSLGNYNLEHGSQVIQNDGTGWRTLIGLIAPVTEDLEGIPGGTLWAWGPLSGFLTAIDVESADYSMQEIRVLDLHVSKEGTALAVTAVAPWFMEYDGSVWSLYAGDPLPFPITRLWTDGDVVFCAGDGGAVVSLGTDGWTVLDAGTVSDVTSIWGFSRNDVWLGTSNGTLHHYDGEAWTRMDWPDMGDGSDSCHELGLPIEGMWGIDSVLFFHTESQLVVWDTASFRVLGYWPCEVRITSDLDFTNIGGLRIMDIWGNSPTEVFIVGDRGANEWSECEEYLLWWDGTNFHWF